MILIAFLIKIKNNEEFMLGVYIHIPFCQRKCLYCAFSSFVDLKEKDRYIEALKEEIENFDYKSYPKNLNLPFEKGEDGAQKPKIDTIYIGGGTPSLLDEKDLTRIFDTLKEKFNIDADSEITLECNPNSLTYEKAVFYRKLSINRLSIGVQSLRDEQLKFIGRLHSSAQALEAIDIAKKTGFTNISCDMLIGLSSSSDQFIEDLKKLIDKGITHISTYMLQVEEGTPLAKMVSAKPHLLPDDDQSVEVYNKTAEFLKNNGFLRYEVSNFAKRGCVSRHNIKYWNGDDYVGFGLSAHSYIKGNRYANANNFADYYAGKSKLEEKLSKKELIEEHIMLGLRYNGGVSIEYLKKLGYNIENNENLAYFTDKNIISRDQNRIYLNPDFYGINNFIIVKLLP